VADDDSTIRLGTQGTQTATFIAGVSSTAITGVDVVVSTDGQLGVLQSSLRYKRDIRSLDDRSQRLWQLRPVSFRYKQDPTGERQYGLIAEEVAKVYPELVVRDNKGEIESVQYRELIPLMLNEMHQQQATLATLKAENASLEARLARLEGKGTLASR
jgi:trimeric autotransporter adhesin